MAAAHLLWTATVLAALALVAGLQPCQNFVLEEATIDGIQRAFSNGALTSRQLVECYRRQIEDLNSELKAVIQVNEEALAQADKADKERRKGGSKGPLHGIPVLLKDNIATAGSLRTTAGSLALKTSQVPRDAFVVKKLKDAGAIILGKASLTEWSGFRSSNMPDGWNAVLGQAKNPYTGDRRVCGSSSGSAISVAANMVTVSLGVETYGSIICPADSNSVVGIKPTVGLTSRAGVVGISERQDSVGVMARTVTDAVHVLDVIAGTDADDSATANADEWIPKDQYKASLKRGGLRGKKLGILRGPYYFPYQSGSARAQAYEALFQQMRMQGAELVDNVVMASPDKEFTSNVFQALAIEFKQSLNEYLRNLKSSDVRSLAEVISFNKNHAKEEKIKEYPQDLFFLANQANENDLDTAVSQLNAFTEAGLKKVMAEKELDAVVAAGDACGRVLAVARFPGISIPVGYDNKDNGMPFGICIGGLQASEPELIEIAYAIEQATRARVPPPTTPAPAGWKGRMWMSN